jgi:3D (Asp-Asp-Asp) domain-containing protein
VTATAFFLRGCRGHLGIEARLDWPVTRMFRDRDSGAFETLGGAMKAGANFLADLIDRIVNGIRGIAFAGAAIGCSSDASEMKVQPPPAVSTAPAPAQAPKVEPKQLGKFSITFYYVIGEEEVVAKKKPKPEPANDNVAESESTELAAVVPPERVTLYQGKSCQPIAEVSREFASQLALQGTGKLRDGRVLNVWGHCKCEHSPCFKVTSAQWGTAGTGRQLQPFRTVAVDPKVIKLGSLLHIPLLEGKVMPGRAPWGGYVHDGCVVADDVGGGIQGKQLDLFVGRKGWFLGLSGSGGSHAWARHVPIYDGTKICERKGRKVTRRAASI